MATKNSILNKSQELTVDPGSGDSVLQFDINSTGEFIIGIDDTDSDAFKISQGSALGTTDTFEMTSSGERLMPLQPCFSAYLSSTLSNATGDGTAVGPVVFDSEVFDQNSDYATGTGIFTAPVTGRYFITGGIVFGGVTSSHTRGTINYISSNSFYYSIDMDFGAIRNSSDNVRRGGGVIMDMDATDTVYINAVVRNGTKVVDILGAARNTSFFCGYLIC